MTIPITITKYDRAHPSKKVIVQYFGFANQQIRILMCPPQNPMRILLTAPDRIGKIDELYPLFMRYLSDFSTINLYLR